MPAITGTYQTTTAAGIREDLSDLIFDISPTETPFQARIARGSKVTQTLHEWQVDSLAPVDTTNAQFMGDDIASFQTATPTSRLQNRTQISRKTIAISGTLEAVVKAGRKSELSYQMAKRGKELKRDLEAILTGNQGDQAESVSAGKTNLLRSLESWYTTNVNMGTGGANGTQGSARTDGTARPFSEALLKDVLQKVWVAGGSPDLIMVGPHNKVAASTFAGNSTRMSNADEKKLIAAIDVYESDWGVVDIVPNRFSRDRSAHVITAEYWALAFLRPIQIDELAKTGDAEKKFVICEYTLEARNEAASGLIADLATT